MSSRKVSVAQALGTQGRLLLKRLIDFTPPLAKKKVTKSDGSVVSGVTAYAQGRKAVKYDVRRAIFPLAEKNFRDPSIRRMIRTRNYIGLNQVFRRKKLGFLKGVEIVKFDHRLHARQRDSRGRVNRKKPLFATPDVNEHNAYTQLLQSRVGMAKGGWAAAYAHFGGKPAAWYGKWASQGTYEDHKDDPQNPYIKFRNQSPWGDNPKADQTMRAAIKSRERDIKTAIMHGHLFAIKKRLKRIA